MADIHITQDMLDAVSRGELPPRVVADIGVRHLLTLCPHCRDEFQAWRKRRSGSGDSSSAREEGLTVERVEGFIRYFKKARGNPGLRFGR